MLLLLLIILCVIALPALAYCEYLRRYGGGHGAVEPPFDEMNHDPPKSPDNPGRLPNITDIGGPS